MTNYLDPRVLQSREELQQGLTALDAWLGEYLVARFGTRVPALPTWSAQGDGLSPADVSGFTVDPTRADAVARQALAIADDQLAPFSWPSNDHRGWSVRPSVHLSPAQVAHQSGRARLLWPNMDRGDSRAAVEVREAFAWGDHAYANALRGLAWAQALFVDERDRVTECEPTEYAWTSSAHRDAYPAAYGRPLECSPVYGPPAPVTRLSGDVHAPRGIRTRRQVERDADRLLIAAGETVDRVDVVGWYGPTVKPDPAAYLGELRYVRPSAAGYPRCHDKAGNRILVARGPRKGLPVFKTLAPALLPHVAPADRPSALYAAACQAMRGEQAHVWFTVRLIPTRVVGRGTVYGVAARPAWNGHKARTGKATTTRGKRETARRASANAWRETIGATATRGRAVTVWEASPRSIPRMMVAAGDEAMRAASVIASALSAIVDGRTDECGGHAVKRTADRVTVDGFGPFTVADAARRIVLAAA